MNITLPYPPARLSPNKRLHWAVRAQIVAQYRRTAWALTMEAMGVAWCPPAKRPLPITITFHPPDRRRRDRDNMIAAFKAGADGVADAIGVDDADWFPTYAVGEPIKGGCVNIKIGDPA